MDQVILPLQVVLEFQECQKILDLLEVLEDPAVRLVLMVLMLLVVLLDPSFLILLADQLVLWVLVVQQVQMAPEPRQVPSLQVDQQSQMPQLVLAFPRVQSIQLGRKILLHLSVLEDPLHQSVQADQDFPLVQQGRQVREGRQVRVVLADQTIR